MPLPRAANVAKLISINPGLITIKVPIKPMDTAVHLLKPTFSFKKKGDIAVTQIGATNARVKALGKEISDIAKKNKYVENTKINPLIN